MISADQARNYTQTKRDVTLAEQETKVENYIKAAIDNGEMQCHVYLPLKAKLIQSLKSLGYDVKSEFDKNESYYVISWEFEQPDPKDPYLGTELQGGGRY